MATTDFWEQYFRNLQATRENDTTMKMISYADWLLTLNHKDQIAAESANICLDKIFLVKQYDDSTKTTEVIIHGFTSIFIIMRIRPGLEINTYVTLSELLSYIETKTYIAVTDF